MSQKNSRFLIVNADDFGLSEGTNLAIAQAHRKGILTSTSLLVTCNAFDHALNIIKKNPKLGVGIHLSTNLGRPVAKKKEIPDLLDQGILSRHFTSLMRNTNHFVSSQLYIEFESQILKALNSGVKIDHLDSQSHIHMIPYIFKIVIELAIKYNIKFIRLSKDSFITTSKLEEIIHPITQLNFVKLTLLNSLAMRNRKFIKDVRVSDKFFGVYQSGNINESILQKMIVSLRPGITELITHPAYPDIKYITKEIVSQKIDKFMLSDKRKSELNALLSPKVRESIKKNHINLITFKEASLL